MPHRQFRGKFVVSLLVLLVTGQGAFAQEAEPARRLHREAFVFDAHVHIINRQFHQGGHIADRYPDGHVDLPRIVEGGVDALLFSLYVPELYYPGRHETKHVLRLMDLALRQIADAGDHIEIALDGDDIDRIQRAGKIAAVLDLEGGFDLDGDLGILRTLYRLGLRSAQLPAHNWGNAFADSCCAPARWGGLNGHGRRVIEEMNRLGMLINISHASDQTIDQAIDVSADPLVATHHGLRSRNDIPRTMPLRLLKKLAAKGGVLGIQIGHSFHSPAFHDWKTRRAGRAFWDTSSVEDQVRGLSIEQVDRIAARAYPFVGPTPPDDLFLSIDDWLEVVEEAMATVGEDHVALGTDFDGGPTPPRGIRDISDLPRLTAAMLRRGWTQTRIRKFLGANLLRVFRQVTAKSTTK